MRVTFTIPGKPQGKGRPRASRDGHMYTPKTTREYEKLISICYKMQSGLDFGDAPISMSIRMYFPIPKSTPKAKRVLMVSDDIRPTVKPDIDNVMKSICDALNGIAYKDDTQIVSAFLYKYYAEDPRVDVDIEEVYP